MATVPEGGHTSVRSMLPILGASTIGTSIEWYDFFLYGFLAATVFPKVFFPTLDPVAGTIASFTTNFVGFLARPIGGAFFGWFGDRVGRKSTLIATLLLMGIATALMGFLPGYASIGIAAPILLSILRFLQGAGVGGEWGGSVLLSLEYGDDRRRGFWTSWPQTGVPVGLALAAIAVLAFQAIFPGTAFEWSLHISGNSSVTTTSAIASAHAVPEPSSLLLAGAVAAGVAWRFGRPRGAASDRRGRRTAAG